MAILLCFAVSHVTLMNRDPHQHALKGSATTLTLLCSLSFSSHLDW